MYRWRVRVTLWDGNIVNEYFYNKTSAYEFYKQYYKEDPISIEIFQYTKHIWKLVKIYL